MAYYRNAMSILEYNVLQSFKRTKLGKVQSRDFEMSVGLTLPTGIYLF